MKPSWPSGVGLDSAEAGAADTELNLAGVSLDSRKKGVERGGGDKGSKVCVSVCMTECSTIEVTATTFQTSVL